jgi:diacylglycerol kinase family enzyme
VRALLIVNPRATSTTRLRRDVIASALASAVELDVVETRYRGHATNLAASARSEGYGLVLTLGGDGTVNEAVNGILGRPEPAPASPAPASPAPAGRPQDKPDEPGRTPSGPGQAPSGPGWAPGEPGRTPGGPARTPDGPGRTPADRLPALAALPGGSANVFAGSLGLGRDPVDAAGQILQALAEHRERTIGLGLAEGRYFTFNSGLGLDAEVVRAVQGLRAHGKPVTPALYVRLTLRQFYRQTDRKRPTLLIELDGQPSAGPVFLGIVSNTAPWTYLGGRAVQASPQAAFDCGLDLFAMRTLSSFGTFRTIGQMLTTSGRPPHGRSILAFHDQPSVTLRSERPVAFQIDGEYVGEREVVTFRSVPDALRVVA